MSIRYRLANLSDVDQLINLIELSARHISSQYYTNSEVDAALGDVWTVDRQLISDQTYWLAESNKLIVGCGGWSKRKLLFGCEETQKETTEELQPGIDSARIRAFFVHPNFVRQGIASGLLERCEHEAARAGFTRLELVATLSGAPFYSQMGYLAKHTYTIQLRNNQTNKVISMTKEL